MVSENARGKSDITVNKNPLMEVDDVSVFRHLCGSKIIIKNHSFAALVIMIHDVLTMSQRHPITEGVIGVATHISSKSSMLGNF